MLQLGWAMACSRVAALIASRLQRGTGRPRPSGSAAAPLRRWSRSNTWKIAECSESTGMIRPPAARAIASSSRAGANQAFLVRQPDRRACPRRGQGRRKAGRADDGRHHPVRALSGGFDDGRSARGGRNAGAAAADPATRSGRFRPRSPQLAAANAGPVRRDRATFRPAVRARISHVGVGRARARSRVETPTDPVDPRMTTVRLAISGPSRNARSAGRRRTP